MDRHRYNAPGHHHDVSHHKTTHYTPKYTDFIFIFFMFIFIFYYIFIFGNVKPTDNRPTVRFYTKAKIDYSLTIRDGDVVLAPSNPSDQHQHWIKEEKFSTRVMDEEGFPSFALVNKATGQAIKHAVGAEHPVRLVEYNPDKLDESVLWTQSMDLGDGFHAVRMANNIKLNVDAWNGDKNHGGVHDGTKIYLFKWTTDDNQRWMTAPFYNKPIVRFYTKAKGDYSLTIRVGHVVLAPTNPYDHHQHWIKEEKFSTGVKDEEGFPSFAIVNKATGQAIKHAVGAEHPVQLVEYNPDKLDESVLWTQSKDLGDGYHAVRVVNNIKLNVDAWNADKNHGGVHDGTKIYLFKWTNDDNQRWTTAPFYDKPTVRFYTKAERDYSVTIRDGHVVLAPTNPSDHHQHWIKEEFSTIVKDEEGFPSFALVNKATGQAIKHAVGAEHPVQLVEYNPNKFDESVLWTQSKDLGDGFHAVRMVNNIKLNLDAWNGDKNHGGVHDGTEIYLFKWTKDDNQRWTTAPF